ncbi:MAG: ABC transporter ATP-binding protein [Clostridiales bacterium]|nr:ABC transporter ATP-binding protein [Clostridiales bacterium]
MSDREYKRRPPRRGPGAPMVGEKPKNFKNTWLKIIKYSKTYAIFIFIAIILAVIGSVLTVIGPRYIEDLSNAIKDGIITSIDFNKVNKIALIFGVISVLSIIFQYARNFIMVTVSQKISRRMRTDISHKINKIPLNYFNRNSIGDVLSRVTNDIDSLSMTLNQSVGGFFSSVTMLVGSLVMMIVTNPLMALVAVLSSLLGFILMFVIIGKSQKYFTQQQDYLGEINGVIEETYTGQAVVKAYNAEEKINKSFNKINNKLYTSSWKSQFLSGLMQPIMGFVGNFGYVAVCLTGAALALDNKIEFGVIVAFMIYIKQFTQPLSNIAQAATGLQSAAAAGERVFEFLEEDELSREDDKKQILQSPNGDVEFKNIVFGYTPEKLVIKNFSAHAKSGQKVAIVGPTGAGKTTIVNLLMRFYELDGGQILIDGIPTSELTRNNVHSMFCMVLQDTWLFEGTVRENIVYVKENVSDEQLKQVCKVVGIHKFIKTLPNGYDTILDDKAVLSAGQKQLITIARAMIQNAPLLILDEATSSVDTRTEIQIQKAMDELTKGRTSFVIAHRLSTIKNADLILVMKDGDILESGNHEELLAKNGFYAELYNSQFEPQDAS